MGENEQASVWAVAAQWLLWTRIPHARSWLPIRFQYQYRYRPPRVPQMVSRLTTRPFFTYPCRFLARLQLNRVLSRRISEWEGLTQRQKGENAEPPELFYATAPQNPLPKAWIRALTLSPPCPKTPPRLCTRFSGSGWDGQNGKAATFSDDHLARHARFSPDQADLPPAHWTKGPRLYRTGTAAEPALQFRERDPDHGRTPMRTAVRQIRSQ